MIFEEPVDGFQGQFLPAGNHLGNSRLEFERATEIESLTLQIVIASQINVGAWNSER